MNLFDKSVYITIAICYNLFIHHIVNIMYKDLPFDEKFDKSISFIFIAGILAIVFSKLIQKDSFTESVLCMGFFIGGLLLIITALWVNWDNLSDEMRMILSISVFGTILWYAYKYDKSRSQNTENTN